MAALRSSSISQTPTLWLSPSSASVFNNALKNPSMIGLANEQIDGDLHDVGLNLRQAIGATTLDVFADQRGAQDFRIAGLERQRGRASVVTFDFDDRLLFRHDISWKSG